ncbi:MAG: hypothetical protein WDM85_01260 [Caulobacteraceae bacterium]
MTLFKINELSGVDKPAAAGALVAIMKRDAGAEPVNPTDLAIAEMTVRGAVLARKGQLRPEDGLPFGPGVGRDNIDWEGTRAAMAGKIDELAKARAAADKCSYEAAYSKEFAAAPSAVQSIVLGR